MKFIAVIIAVGVIGTIVADNKGLFDTEVTNEVEVVEQPTPEELFEAAVQQTIEAAITASSTDIQAAKEKAAQEVEDEMKKEIEDRVRKEMRDKV